MVTVGSRSGAFTVITNTLMVGIIAIGIFALAVLASYAINYQTLAAATADTDIVVMENNLAAINKQIHTLEHEADLMPITQSWLKVLEIVEQYPNVAWQVNENAAIAGDGETSNVWHAVMIAPPDLVMPVMRTIQRTVPAEVSDIQLNQRQGVLSINILGVVK